jgi:hypothetical protein
MTPEVSKVLRQFWPLFIVICAAAGFIYRLNYSFFDMIANACLGFQGDFEVD